jgi:hypothetical protein
LSQVLLALLPLTLPIIIAATKIVLALTPRLLFPLSPCGPLLIGQTTSGIAISPAIRIIIRTSLLIRDSALLIALPLPLTLLLRLLLALISTLIFQAATLVIILSAPVLSLSIIQPALLVSLSPLLVKYTLLVLNSALIVRAAFHVGLSLLI